VIARPASKANPAYAGGFAGILAREGRVARRRAPGAGSSIAASTRPGPGRAHQLMRRHQHTAPLTAALACVGAAIVLGACGVSYRPSPAVLQSSSTASAASVSGPVAVSPEYGTADASPATQISFLGPAGTHVTSIRVVGSSTGLHTGVLRSYSTGTGQSFIPYHPFREGERVSVSARVSLGAGDAAARTLFTIGHQAAVSTRGFPNNPGDPSAVQRYGTLPGVAPSSVRVTTPAAPAAAPGYLFLAPYQGFGTPGPMITDQAGRLVWFHAVPPGDIATNFSPQTYQGKPVLTWWQGKVLEIGFGQGEEVIYNSSYRQIGHIRAGNGYHADLHSLHITPEGTAWVDAFNPIHMNLTSYGGGSNDILTDGVVQEVDIRTGLVMWEWHALGHVPVTESHNPEPQGHYPWDYVHVNAISPGTEGDVLLSARNTWALYDVDIRTGAVRWRLGGTHSSFKFGPGVQFYWQHDAAWQPGGLISMFDNGSDPPYEKQSRGLLLAPNVPAHTVTLVKALVNPRKTLLASSQGNDLSLPEGRWLLGYGGLPNFTEFDASGHVLLDGTLGHNVQDFRTFVAPWEGHAPGAPAVLASPTSGGLSVSVSWNGATGVAAWRVLAGSSPSALSQTAQAARAGFQTTIAVAAKGPYVMVQALDDNGAVIGSSATLKA